MAMITIYQGASGSGEELAEAVAQALGYGCVNRELLIQASLRYGIPEAKLNDIVEKEPHWWNRFVENLTLYRLALQPFAKSPKLIMGLFTTDIWAMSFCQILSTLSRF